MLAPDPTLQLREQIIELQEEIRNLTEAFAPVDALPVTLLAKVTKTQRRILAALYTRKWVRVEALAILMGNEPGTGTIRTHMSHLRARMPQGVRIRAMHGEGYFMPYESKKILRALDSASDGS